MNRLFKLIALLILGSCSTTDNPSVMETEPVENEEAIQEESSEGEEVFEDLELIDWKYYYNGANDEVFVESVMANKDSTYLLESYKGPSGDLRYLFAKDLSKEKFGVYEIKEGLPEKFYLSNGLSENRPITSIELNDEGYFDLIYHDYVLDIKVSLTKFIMVQNGGDIEFLEYEGAGNKFGHRDSSPCDNQDPVYEGPEVCLQLARSFWCEKFDNWRNRAPNLLFAIGVNRLIGSKNLINSSKAKYTETALFDNVTDELLTTAAEETVEEFAISVSQIFESLSSFLIEDVYRGIVNGVCGIYGFELAEFANQDYVVVLEEIKDQELVQIDLEQDFIENVALFPDSDTRIAAWADRAIPNLFRVKMLPNLNSEVPQNYTTNLVWLIKGAGDLDGTHSYRRIGLNNTNSFAPPIPSAAGSYTVTAFLLDKPSIFVDFILEVTEDELVLIFNGATGNLPYSLDPENDTLRDMVVSLSVYDKTGDFGPPADSTTPYGVGFYYVGGLACCDRFRMEMRVRNGQNPFNATTVTAGGPGSNFWSIRHRFAYDPSFSAPFILEMQVNDRNGNFDRYN